MKIKKILFLWSIEKTFLKNRRKTYDNIQKIQQVKEMITHLAVYLSQQQALDVDPKPIQETNFTGNLDRSGITKIYSFHLFFFRNNQKFKQSSRKSLTC